MHSPAQILSFRGARLIAILAALSLLFAAQHLAMHDLDDSGRGPIGHQECQLDHLPYAHLPAPCLGLPASAPAVLLAALYLKRPLPVLVHSWLARAPPLP